MLADQPNNQEAHGYNGGRKIPIGHKRTKRQQRTFFLSVLILFIFSIIMIDIDWRAMSKGLERLPILFSGLTQISFENFWQMISGMITTVVIAFLAVLFSFIISFFLSFLVANNTTPNRVIGNLLRYGVMVIRSVPTPIWVLIAVASIGFGPMAGIIGLMFPTSSFLIKAFSAQIEEEGTEVIEAIRSVGGTWIHVVFKGLLPTIFTGMMATLGVRFEIDVHESVVLGMVGAGGIGYLLQSYIMYYDFANLTLGILIVFVTMFLIELALNRIRAKLRTKSS